MIISDGSEGGSVGQPRPVCAFVSPGYRTGASSMMATARVQPADPPRTLTGKQLTDESLGRQCLEIVQLLDVAIADLTTGLVAFPDQARVMAGEYFSRVWTNGASQLQPSVPVTRTPRSSR